MIILIMGPSHVGKTNFAQKLLEKYQYPYVSIDHLKMGLIRSGNTTLTPLSDDEDLTSYLWPIVREMVKTAIENQQHLIVEGCYIPFNWKDDFDEAYEFLLSKGFVNPRGDKITETNSSRSTMLFAPSGFGITLTQHIKK